MQTEMEKKYQEEKLRSQEAKTKLLQAMTNALPAAKACSTLTSRFKTAGAAFHNAVESNPDDAECRAAAVRAWLRGIGMLAARMDTICTMLKDNYDDTPMLILAGLNDLDKHDQAKLAMDSKLLASDVKLLCMASEYVVP